MTAFLYALSQILDAFDGWAARKFNQCNAFGAVLDMVCDRVSDAIMLAILASLYPSYSAVFLLAIGLDISSHWYQTYSTQYCREEHHKTAKTEWKLLHIYYNAKNFLFIMVFGMEVRKAVNRRTISSQYLFTVHFQLFLVNMYLKAYEHSIDVPDWFKLFNSSLLLFSIPIFVLKSVKKPAATSFPVKHHENLPPLSFLRSSAWYSWSVLLRRSWDMRRV